METQTTKHRYGMVKARLKSRHVLLCPDGTRQQFEVTELRRKLNARTICLCFDCGKKAETEDALIAAHPEQYEMAKLKEKHTYAWVHLEDIKLDDKGKPIDPKAKDTVIGLLSNVD